MNNESPVSSHSSMDSQTLLNQMVMDYLKEQKRRRKWKWVLRILFLLIIAYIGIYLLFFNGDDNTSSASPHVGLVDLRGEIFDGKGGNADDFARGIDTAYKNKALKALIIRINSPGGSPVQAEYMFNTIKYYKTKFPDVKTYAVCVDLCASAAYYVAVAADEIYASPASMIGSIGVVYSGFGFVDVMNKVGVSRRLQTAGVNKGFLDPFSPTNEFQTQKLQVMLDAVHQQFINRVKEGRGSRLHIDKDTFSGLAWVGDQALAMGLIDGFASSGQLARDVIKIEELVDYTHKQNLFDRVTKSLGAAMADELPVSLGVRQGLR